MKNNITLIGMPGSGKSTVGVVLAKRLGRRFVDSDLVIQDRHGKLLHELSGETAGGSECQGSDPAARSDPAGSV